MKLSTRQGTVTFEDFCQLVREDQKADLINGIIYMASPENTDANKLFMWFGGILHDFVEEHQLGEILGSRVAMRLDDRNAPEPDLLFVRADHLHLVERGCVNGPADLAVEIVSPDSVERDYVTKRQQYEHFGVPEYWIIDEEMQKVTLLRLGKKGKYREVKAKKGELHSEVLTGFWFRPEWFWQNPRPKKKDILQFLLADSPK